jgi:hypothetical protein
MDAAGARALAQRIEEQRAREEEEALTTAAPAQLSFAAAPRMARPPAVSISSESAHSVSPAGHPSERRRDIRRYTTDVRQEDKGDGPILVTTIRRHSLVDGRWQSRVVEVRIDPV